MNIVKYEKMIDEKLAMLKEEMIKEMMRKIEEEQENEFPKHGDDYYYLDTRGAIECTTWDGDEFDRDLLAIGNIIPTEKEAEFEAERRKVIKELRKYAEPKDRTWDGKNKHYLIVWDYGKNKVDYYNYLLLKSADIYFESEEKAKEAIRMVGEDRVKKYYLRVED